MEIKDLLGPCVTLLAVILAIFAFSLPKSLDLFKERHASMSEVDVPDSVRKQKKFQIFVLGDSLLLFFISGVALFIGISLLVLLIQIVSIYLSSNIFSNESILIDFRDTLIWLLVVLSLVTFCTLLLFTNEVLLGEKKLPLLARVYARNVLRRKTLPNETIALLPEANKLFLRETYREAILYGFASLEAEFQNKFNLPANAGFGTMLATAREYFKDPTIIEKLLRVRRLRNTAAHPSEETVITKKDTKDVLDIVKEIHKLLAGEFVLEVITEAKSKLEGISGRDKAAITRAFSGLKTNPYSTTSVKRLRDSSNWVKRVGKYRLVYNISESQKLVTIVDIAKTLG